MWPIGRRHLIGYYGGMPDGLSRLECSICGQSIYFSVTDENESVDRGQDKFIEVTCPRGHSDRFTAAELRSLDSSGKLEQAHLAAAAAF